METCKSASAQIITHDLVYASKRPTTYGNNVKLSLLALKLLQLS